VKPDAREGTSRLLAALRRAAHALAERNQQWALVGGLAVSIRSEPRFTRDIHLAVAVPNDQAAEALVGSLTAAGFTLRLSLEHDALRRLGAVRLTAPDEPEEGVVVDLLFASSGIESEICRDAEPLEISPGLVVPVAQTGHLVAMKLLAIAPDRPQDRIDLERLVPSLSVSEREQARAAVARIEALGAHRSRPLREHLERWIAGQPL
jgi:hypothetical protein